MKWTFLAAIVMATFGTLGVGTATAKQGNESVILEKLNGEPEFSPRKLIDRSEEPGTGEVTFTVHNATSKSMIFQESSSRGFLTEEIGGFETYRFNIVIGTTAFFSVEEKRGKHEDLTVVAKAPHRKVVRFSSHG